MSKREISIVLKAKNSLQAGLAKAKSTLTKFGSAVGTVGKWIGAAFIAGGAAIAAFSAKALSAYAVQQKATESLRSSLRSYGDEVDQNTQKISKLAAAIQNETAVGDEVLIQRAARLRLLGVEVNEMEDALKATIALASAGMSEEQSIKAVAQAREGNYRALQQYIPALKTASTESEKADILNKFLTAGYAQQAATLNTVSGRWAEFKGRVGDLWEEFGRVIERSAGVQKMLAAASEGVRKFGEAISRWADSQSFVVMQQSIEGIVNALMRGGEARTGAVQVVGNYISAALARGAEIAGGYLMQIAPEIGKLIGAAARAAMPDAAQQRSIKAAAADLGIKTGPLFGAFGKFMSGVTDEQREQIKLRAMQLRQEELMSELGLKTKINISGQTEAQARLSAATQTLNAYARQYVGSWAPAVQQATKSQITITRKAAVETEDAAEEYEEAEEKKVRATKWATDELQTEWDSLTDREKQQFEEIYSAWESMERRRVSVSQQASDEIIEAKKREHRFFALTPGGSFESPAGFRETKLRLAGLSGLKQGQRLTTQQADALRGVSSKDVLAELRRMNGNLEANLRWG